MDEKVSAARPKVEELFDAEGSRSPMAKDKVRRRVGVGLFEETQALYVYCKFKTLYALYCQRYPANPISFSTFAALRPWYVRRAKQETCLCKQCTNFKNYLSVLNSLVELFEPVVAAPSGEDGTAVDDESEANDWDGKTFLLRLLELCKLKSKSEIVKFCLCDVKLAC